MVTPGTRRFRGEVRLLVREFLSGKRTKMEFQSAISATWDTKVVAHLPKAWRHDLFSIVRAPGLRLTPADQERVVEAMAEVRPEIRSAWEEFQRKVL